MMQIGSDVHYKKRHECGELEEVNGTNTNEEEIMQNFLSTVFHTKWRKRLSSSGGI